MFYVKITTIKNSAHLHEKEIIFFRAILTYI